MSDQPAYFKAPEGISFDPNELVAPGTFLSGSNEDDPAYQFQAPPVDPRWAHFDASKMIADLRKRLDAWAAIVLPFLDSTAAGHAAISLSQVLASVEQANLEATIVSRSMSNLSISSSRFLLKPYFAEDKASDLPHGPAPPDTTLGITLAIFRSHYPLIRRIILAFDDKKRQQAWGYVPATISKDPKQRRMNIVAPQNHKHYAMAFGALLGVGLHILDNFAAVFPTRFRMANDVVLLDATASIVLSHPNVAQMLSDPTWKTRARLQPATLNQTLESMFTAIECVSMSLLANLGPFREAHPPEPTPRGKVIGPKSSVMTAVNFCHQVMDTLHSDFKHSGPASGVEMAANLIGALLIGDNASRNYVTNVKEQLNEIKDGDDRCDSCGRTGRQANCEGGKLKRCSRCRVGMYCSKECMTKDWKDGGHKKVCFQATN